MIGLSLSSSVNTICGRIMIGLSFSSVSKHNMCRIMIGLSLLLSVSKYNMWSYYDWVYYLPSVNTICGRVMIGLSLSSVSKHNMWLYYDWIVVVFRQ